MRTSLYTMMVILGWASAATAAPITFNFAASQISEQTPGGLASLAAPWTTITGSFTYDTDTPPSSVNIDTALYPTGALQIDQFNVGTGVFTAPFSTSVINNGIVVGDAFVLQTGGSFPGVPAGTYDLVQLNLSDPTGGVLSSTALPTSLGLWPARTITFQRFQIAAGGATSFLGATSYDLNRLELAPATTPVPEPATLILIGSGLVAGLRRRMRKAA